jgi:hypothetical protein
MVQRNFGKKNVQKTNSIKSDTTNMKTAKTIKAEIIDWALIEKADSRIVQNLR